MDYSIPSNATADELWSSNPVNRAKLERFKVETPLGSLESDSGNHMYDVLSVVSVIGLLYIGKAIISRIFKGIM